MTGFKRRLAALETAARFQLAHAERSHDVRARITARIAGMAERLRGQLHEPVATPDVLRGIDARLRALGIRNG